MTKLITPVHSGIVQSTTPTTAGLREIKGPPLLKSSVQRIALKDILRDPFLQVRDQVNPQVVRKYSEAMKAGADFPPIKLARVNGSLYLVDGWHRFSAATDNGHYLIWAEVSDMTFDQVRWEAAKANSQHGLPLKTKEYRKVFRAFIESGQHKCGKKVMPYREIASHIGKTYSTIRNWMRADYPKLYARYQMNANGFSEEAGDYQEAKETPDLYGSAQVALCDIRNIGRTLDPARLGSLLQALKETVSDLEARPYEPVAISVYDF